MPTPTLLWQRSIESDVSGVEDTFTSWDKCMDEAYCKWPAIIGIILGCLIVLSILFCLVRCLCCGLECCCSCFSCCNVCASCCNGGRRRRNQGYSQPPAQPQLQPYPQYQSAPPPMYGAPQNYAQPQYARFESSKSAAHNEDALPIMPGWDSARTTRAADNAVEMNRLNDLNNHPAAPMLPVHSSPYTGAGDLGMMGGPQYHDSHDHGYAPMSYDDPYVGYSNAQSQQEYSSGAIRPSAYAAPPSYHTTSPTATTPAVGRKPVGGSWRDI